MQIYFCLKISINLISTTNEIKRTDRWMVTDLFCIDWTPINETLVSFSQNRVESFFYIEVENAVSKGKSYALLKSF